MEKIYNVYLFHKQDVCGELGYVSHVFEGSDEEAINYLRAKVSSDLPNAKRLSLRKPFSRSEYLAHCRLGGEISLLEELFQTAGAAESVLYVATPVMDGAIEFNYTSRHGKLDITDVAAQMGAAGRMPDWLEMYTTEAGMDLPRLIHDDYYLAIRLTFNNRKFVSSMKLMVSFVDSIAYIEYGDIDGAFVKWLGQYADLALLGITGEELWELRNGLLHMTNIHSRAVLKSKVRRISFRVGGPADYPRELDGIYYFDFATLLVSVIPEALRKWISTYNDTPEKFPKFVERYDETLSDSRMAISRLGEVPLASPYRPA